MAARAGPRLGDGRICDAAARHPGAHAARDHLRASSGRTQEIQRLIGRSLRAVTDLQALGERQITIDCDVLQADGGTRTAAITGGWVALHECLKWMHSRSIIKDIPLRDHVAAISCGMSNGEAVLDLDYIEDSAAQTDANFVITGAGALVEIQASAEAAVFSEPISTPCWRWRAKVSPNSSRFRSRPSPDMSRRLTGRLIIATHNPGKLWEMQALLKPYGIEAVSAGELGLPEPEETGATFLANAELKARVAAQAAQLPALADDSGLCVDALDGAPGLHSARWAEVAPGGAAISAPRSRRSSWPCRKREPRRPIARISSPPLRSPGRTAHAGFRRQGTWYACLSAARHEGFGYDPIFLPDGLSRTFGEMMMDEKQAIPPDGSPALSHRARAFQAFARACL